MAVGDHLYTLSPVERDNAVTQYDYVEEGTAFFAFAAPTAGAVPLLRLRHTDSGVHLYTTSQVETDAAISQYGYQFEGICCHVYGSATPDTMPLLRLFNQTNGDHFYTTSQFEANNAVTQHGYAHEGIACYVLPAQAPDSHPVFRLLGVQPGGNPWLERSPWAVLLCRLNGVTGEVPVDDYDDICRIFFTERNHTFNAVQFFSDMSHGKLDLTGSAVLGWYDIDVDITGTSPLGDPMLNRTQLEIRGLAMQAARDDDIEIDDFAGVIVILNVSTGNAQGYPNGFVIADWRRVDMRTGGGQHAPRAIRGGNGTEVFGQEMGHGYGIAHSRRDGSNDDYQDAWDIMSTPVITHAAVDADYGARGPGFNAWGMRGRKWLNESRIWKPPAGTDFSQQVQLRPLHQRHLAGYLGAELPGTGDHSPYLVEFRVPELWDAGIPEAVVLVHRYSGAEENNEKYSEALIGRKGRTHSYLMPGKRGTDALRAGDIFEIGTGPVVRAKVLAIDVANRIATLQLSRSANPLPAPKLSVGTVTHGCYPPLVEFSPATFSYKLKNVEPGGTHTIKWTVMGALNVYSSSDSEATFSIRLPDPSVSVTVTATVTLDDGSVLAASLTFKSLLLAEADFRNDICQILKERKKPNPWWEWEPARIRAALREYGPEDLRRLEENLERALEALRRAQKSRRE